MTTATMLVIASTVAPIRGSTRNTKNADNKSTMMPGRNNSIFCYKTT